jgi:thiol-disulfide isomerase/thioredoxin
MMVRLITVLKIALVLVACASAPPNPRAGHGRLSELSRVEGELVLCDHKVPSEVCTRHHPELVAGFKKVGDWCTPHGVPESQCFACHPDLTFEPLAKVGPEADIAVISKAGEDVGALELHAVKGKVTIFDFYADWCAACRKVDGHVYKRIAGGDKLAYRKLNVVDWDSPIATRYVKNVPSLPYLVVFGPDGKQATAIHGADLAALDRAIAAATPSNR